MRPFRDFQAVEGAGEGGFGAVDVDVFIGGAQALFGALLRQAGAFDVDLFGEFGGSRRALTVLCCSTSAKPPETAMTLVADFPAG